MKDFLLIVLAGSIFCSSLLLSGCAGRDGIPVASYKPGDEKRSCVSLKTEIAQLDNEIATLTPKSHKGGYNTIMFIGGLFVIVPFFFMDLKNGEKVELQACRQRQNALSLMAAQQGCILADGGEAQNTPVSETSSSK